VAGLMDVLMSAVMKKLTVQLMVIVSALLILAGCTGREGSEEVEDPAVEPPTTIPEGQPVPVVVDEPFLGQTAAGNVALFSFTEPDTIDDNPENDDDPEIVNIIDAEDDIVVLLNTLDDIAGAPDVSIVVAQDTVYKIDHTTNERQLINHFSNKVCEVIPVEIATESGTNFTVLHDELIYVVTVGGDDSTENCHATNNKKRYYELPFNYLFDSSQRDDTTTSDLVAVTEALARSQLLFGWVTDPNDEDNQILSYGYLGYGLAEQELNLYDQDRALQWSQSRELQIFPVEEIDGGVFSSEFLFKLTELERQQYMLQLGLDVFVFDSGSELLSKGVDETETILTDRTFKIAPTVIDFGSSELEFAQAVTALFDDDDLLLIDDFKVFNYKYTAALPDSDPDGFVVKQKHQSINDTQAYRSVRSFSQFDYRLCENDTDPDANLETCQTAHDLISGTWQFIDTCESSLGCVIDNTVADNCETAAEKLISQSDEVLCGPYNYLHLSELNQLGNDAEFRGFMQYGAAGYIQDLDLILNENSLFITARMYEKEVFLRYSYLAELSEPKANREVVLFGDRFPSYGLDAYIEDNNLFMTMLTPKATRHNECYKNYQIVTCDLGNQENGSQKDCTGKDLEEKLCFDTFTEYESLALFCSADNINAGNCTDNQLFPSNTLSVEADDKDAKWLRLDDISTDDGKPLMYLLLGNAFESIDEGTLLNPELFKTTDNSDVLEGTSSGRVKGKVESTIGGFITSSGIDGQKDILGKFDVISEEIKQEGGASISAQQSVVAKYFHIDTLNSENNVSSDDMGVIKVGEIEMSRVNTQL